MEIHALQREAKRERHELESDPAIKFRITSLAFAADEAAHVVWYIDHGLCPETGEPRSRPTKREARIARAQEYGVLAQSERDTPARIIEQYRELHARASRQFKHTALESLADTKLQ